MSSKIKTSMFAIKINNAETQKSVEEKFEIKVPLYMIYYPHDNFYNSSLWFEMWMPSIEVIEYEEFLKISEKIDMELIQSLKKPWYKRIFR